MADFGKVCGYYVYYTSLCLNEGKCHVHASLGKRENGAAKFWLYTGYVDMTKQGCLHTRDVKEVTAFIESNKDRIIRQWKSDSDNLMVH